MTAFNRGFTSFIAAADAAGMSRLNAGIHFMPANLDSLSTGRTIGNLVVERFNNLTTQAPIVGANLANDAGAAATDSITNDATISGAVVSSAAIKGLAAGFDDAGSGQFASIHSSLEADRRFTLDMAALTSINGGPLSDGAHVLHVIATDSGGHSSDTASLRFTLDRTAPALNVTAPSANTVLDGSQSFAGTASDSNQLQSVSYHFDTEADVLVAVDPTSGAFGQTLDLAGLGNGAHNLLVRATDSAGNTASATIPVSVNLEQCCRCSSARRRRDRGGCHFPTEDYLQ